MKNIYIGYDTREDIAYQVSKFSLINKSKDIEVHPLKLTELRDKQLYWRDEDKLGSTEFTFSRFLVPELNNFKGWALFCDCDLLFMEDVNNLFALTNDQYALMCVKHDYNPKKRELKWMVSNKQFIQEKIGVQLSYGIVVMSLIKK